MANKIYVLPSLTSSQHKHVPIGIRRLFMSLDAGTQPCAFLQRASQDTAPGRSKVLKSCEVHNQKVFLQSVDTYAVGRQGRPYMLKMGLLKNFRFKDPLFTILFSASGG